MKSPKRTFLLSLDDTQVLKGMALVLLLCHHCLYKGEGYDDFFVCGYPVFKYFGMFGNLCVSIFVFLSGYGLTKGAMKNSGIGNPIQFYRRRYVKLMMNYWLIWLLFVPMGVFFFHRSFQDVYGEHYVIRGIVDFLGVYKAVYATPYGYNATWWFYSCIIVLYLIYPLVWKYRALWFLMIPFSIMIVYFDDVPFIGSSGALYYLLPFVCGLSFATLDISLEVGSLERVILLILFVAICAYRYILSHSVRWDSAIIIWGVFLYKCFPSSNLLSKVFAYIGQHSFNIFLFHTFIFDYYFHKCIFWSNNPILICLTLLIVCLIISVFIEKVKVVLKINKLQLLLIG